MKTLLLLCASLGLIHLPAADERLVYRRFGGQLYEVSHSTRWLRKSGTVIQVLDRDRVLLKLMPVQHYVPEPNSLERIGAFFGRGPAFDPPALDTNGPADYRPWVLRRSAHSLAEGNLFRDWVTRAGDFKYTTLSGLPTVVESYDFGEVPQPLPMAATAMKTNVLKKSFDPSRELREVEWAHKQAEAGQAWAQYDLGLRLRDGRGVAADPAQARRWLKLAADQGHDQAKAALAKLPP